MAGGTRTGRQPVENVDRVAGALLSCGAYAEKLDIGIATASSAVEAFLAIEWIGGTRVPVDPHAPPAEAKEVFTAAGVDVILADRAHNGVLATPSLIHDDDAPLLGVLTWPAAIVPPDKTLLLYPRAVTMAPALRHPGIICELACDDAHQYRSLRVRPLWSLA